MNQSPQATLGWFSLHEEEHTVEFLPPHDESRWAPADILPDLAELDAYPWPKHVTLTGKGAVWMYAAWAAFLTRVGVEEISISIPQLLDPVVLRDRDDTTLPTWGLLQYSDQDHYTLDFQTNQEQIAPYDEPFFGLPSLSSHSLCITGRAAVWMYASFAALAVRRGASLITCFIPRQSGRQAIVIYSQDLPTRCGQLIPPPSHLLDGTSGTVLGVVGDPNSGKSVFSHLLNDLQAHTPDVFSHLPPAPKSAPYRGWLFDCDGASPTPHWYLSMLDRGLQDEGKALRDAQKRQWTDALEDDIAHQLTNLRRALPLTIADLPGGKHPKPHHTWPAERVPTHREVMMHHIDSFIILSRTDEEIAKLWRAALEPHGLDGRVGAILVSTNPEAPFDAHVAYDVERCLWIGSVCGLDRAQLPSILQSMRDHPNHPLRIMLKDLVQRKKAL